ncbi:hypothetical protein PHLCEN_2v2061 [Hermanssonia centrifuga]|uniref:PhoD-like phosphatase domain-containing protein n=1 Tax=Hermanssonia centrifuga TaxID=98765 RepID=A0A2R6RQ81_9APHY|nr:hypothetical protein PHLCEN_2v2061 [Hermanssonia centrifuga]
MDNPGWHARHRAKKEDEKWSNPVRGPDGKFKPVEQIYPMAEPFVGGFHPGSQPSTPRLERLSLRDDGPPPPPPKDERYQPSWASSSPPSIGPSWSQSSQDDPAAEDSYMYATQQLAHMTAIERSQNLRVAGMNPILQFMAGPLLRYDTVDEDGVWHGAAMIVTADAGSLYEPYPKLTYAWDPDRPSKMSRVRARSNASRSYGRSFDLGPHPADPLSNVFPGANGSSFQAGPNAIKQSVPAQEIWVYCGNGGTFTFWRFMIHIPLGSAEMRVTYSINDGQEMDFFVPGRSQNMRWAAYSCNGFSAGVNPDTFRGPGFQSGYDPVWTDLLQKHAEEPFHALVGGGDQLYCDGIVREPEMQNWVSTKLPEKKRNYPLTEDMRFAIDRFYFNHYCQIFRSGAFARANSSM